MRKSNWTPSIVPRGDDQNVYMVVDDLGRSGLVWPESDVEGTDLETVLADLMAGQYRDPIRVVSFNIAEGWSQDVTADIAHELRRRCDLQLRDVPSGTQDFVEQHEDYHRQQLTWRFNATSQRRSASGRRTPVSLSRRSRPRSRKGPSGERWIHEIKFDGYRVQVHLANETIQVFTRRGHDWTNRFKKIAADAWHIGAGSAIIDGEVVAPAADGTTDFSVPQNELKGQSTEIVMVAFDLLYLNGYDLRKLPPNERKALLKKLLNKTDIQFSESFSMALRCSSTPVRPVSMASSRKFGTAIIRLAGRTMVSEEPKSSSIVPAVAPTLFVSGLMRQLTLRNAFALKNSRVSTRGFTEL
jgi:hypothetical protein